MALVIVGLNYKTCPLEVREKIAFSKKRLYEAVSFFGNVVILSTCNRVEVYTDEDLDLKQLLCRYHELNTKDIYPFLYEYNNNKVFEHLCKVAAGLDSQIYGEKEILGQVRFAYNAAKPKGTLNKMFIDAFRAVKKIRDTIKIDASIGKTVKEFLGNIEGKKIMILGRGETGRLIAESLNYKCEIIAYCGVREKIRDADILISATGSPHTVIKKNDVPEKPLLILDLAVPRDVEPDVSSIKGVRLFTLDEICGRSAQEKLGCLLSR